MELKESIAVALDSLSNNKLRAFLTMLGIIIGVAAVITMIALGKGAQREVTERIQSLGTNLLFLRPGTARHGRVAYGAGTRISLKEKDAKAILKNVRGISHVIPEFSRQAQVQYENKNWRTSIVGTSFEYEIVRKFHPVEGRFFNKKEQEARARVCVIGATVKENLFGEESPVGKIIKINRMNFLVVGLMETKGQTGWMNQDDQIFIPLQTAQRRLFGVDFLTGITVQVASQSKIDEAIYDIEKVLRRMHRLRKDQDNDFRIRNQADIISTFRETSRTLTFLLASIAAISLIVGGIGIMNIMLVSVTERTREIGIRKAMGARRKDILGQFLIESLVLSFFGGLVGISFGITVSILLTKLARWSIFITPDSILISFLFASVIGIFFGIYPARKAALLEPIEALRYE
ncbi:MAG: ABC transporter permease [Fidelibacterota bacterium]